MKENSFSELLVFCVETIIMCPKTYQQRSIFKKVRIRFFQRTLPFLITVFMGSCISSPTDQTGIQTSEKTVENGSAEAALIYNGNMNISSKVAVNNLFI